MSRSAVFEDFSRVTERPGQGASATQLAMMQARYGWAARFAAGKDVLEAGCGAGMGLSVLAAEARSVTAGDVDEVNLEEARAALANDPRIRLENFDAEQTPFETGSFDLVLLFEAIYYLPDPFQFFAEARRILRPGGRLLVVTVNPAWRGFNPSPFSHRYFTAGELEEALTSAGFEPWIEGAFPERETIVDRLIATVRGVAVRLRLIPRTMRGKQLLKRLFYGRLSSIPKRLPEHVPTQPEGMVAVAQCQDLAAYRTLYVTAQVRSPQPREV